MTQQQQPKVSIISVNYNQSTVTMEMLESLRKITYKNYEVIIVDNASPSDNPDVIKDNYPEITLIKSKKNLGFAGGNNLGIQQSTGKYLFFLNNDTEVTETFLEPLVERMELDERIGMVSPKINFYHSPGIIQYAGFNKMDPYTMRSTGVPPGCEDKGQFTEDQMTHFAHGAAMMVRREAIEKAGMMPDLYFLYYEEVDWAIQIKKAGYIIYLVPRAIIYHKESVSVGKKSPMKVYYMMRNRIIFIRRNTNFLRFITCMMYVLFLVVPKNNLVYLLKGDVKSWLNFNKGLLWNLFHYKGIKQTPRLNAKPK